MLEKPRLVIVGGFLGAGKTTLLDRASRALTQFGQTVGVVTNDQATQLVDSALLGGEGRPVQEVGGGCFCCRFDAFVHAAERLVHERDAEVVMAEAVGSCTDLLATVVRPMQRLQEASFRLAPLSVVVDPLRALEIMNGGAAGKGGFARSVAYVFRKQIEEADVVVLNKADLLAPSKRSDVKERLAQWTDRPTLETSALKDEGVEAWLEALEEEHAPRRTPPEVDYDVYAEGEARLGWLNASIRLRAAGPAPDWTAIAESFLRSVRQGASRQGAEVAHVKLLLAPSARRNAKSRPDGGGARLAANLTSNASAPVTRGALPPSVRDVTLLVNGRVQMDSEALRRLILDSLSGLVEARVEATITNMQSFSPAQPEPTHRLRTHPGAPA